MEQIGAFFESEVAPTALLIMRMIVPLLAGYVSLRCYTSFKAGQRRRDPVVMLLDEASGARFPVLYWENSVGRSRSCDICLPVAEVSRDHAVFMRREEGWFVCDTGSKGGVLVNGRRISGPRLVRIGDSMTFGGVTLTLYNTSQLPEKKRRFQAFLRGQSASPFFLMFMATIVHLMMAVQACVTKKGFDPMLLLPELGVLVLGWGLYTYSMFVQHRISFEIETAAYLLSGIGINLLAATNLGAARTQLAAMFIGVVMFCFLIWFMNDMDRVAKYRLPIGIGALCLFVINLILGTTSFGSKNWIYIGPISIQPSEFIKIAFVFVGTSTLDRLQTRKNITEFLVFTGACIGFLFLMRDLGTALIFFATFLIIAFMRSGSVRTIVLILAAAALGVFLILTFMPYVAGRFSAWGHVWDDPYDTGIQQTRVLTYTASGGLFGMGLGRGYLKHIFAADSDLVFGLLCEEQGLLLGLIVIMGIAGFTLYARSDVTRSRSTFFSIGACAVAGLLLFQTCLNVFGVTDILPLTGVTLPFISAGGSSMASTWGLMAFLKASDERTYAVRRAGKH
ncbi:FtsW/RodA/SpoVE family cell cycle protein [Acutalibacter sp. 1XD8-36]|uniref:FtsW/RodA/SpoVE family cell cycle protein n=1 Tax=Acutalibacter sp. 1XD8-36 TaxID=2320852 RepID=UPI001FADEBDB|nr:FtsW/RodA/SpoVE family cell cycle protein [Acutalibacter sp. 1XD8-36]